MPYNITEDLFSVEDVEGQPLSIITIKEGPFAGVRYNYREVRIRVVDEGTPEENMVLEFTYDIVDGNAGLAEDGDFKQFIGDTLRFIIMDSLEDDSAQIGEKNVDTIDSDNDTSESAE